MSLVVHHNVAARFARMHLDRAQAAIKVSTDRMSSGYRLNRAADDTTAFAMSMRFQSDLTGYETVNRNARNGMNLIGAMEGTTNEILNVLNRMRELATKNATETMTATDRSEAQIEFGALQAEIQRLAQTTHMNRVQGLALSETMTFQVGVGGGAANQTVLQLRPMTVAALSLDAPNTNISNLTTAQTALDQIDVALSRLNTRRSQLAATYNQLESAFNVTAADRDSLLNTLNVIRDTDYAVESTNLAQNQIRSQAAVSILAQANTIPQLALQLLQS
jgi:flagellin